MDELRPRDVPAYAYALANGVIRPVAHTPPPLLPGRSAQRAFHLFLIKGAAATAAYVVLMEVLSRLLDPNWLQAALYVALGLAWFIGILRMFRNIGPVNLEEMRHGYTTFQMTSGSFFYGGTNRWREMGPPWDYSGLWVLDQTTGAVKKAPNFEVDPPGLYPSPNREGSLELWTGSVWSGHFREYPE